MALTDSLQGYWKLDESSGNPVDSSGNSVTLTNTNTVSFGAGKINNCADAGSANTNKNLVTSSVLGASGTAAFTMGGWFNINTAPGTNVNTCLMSFSGATTNANDLWYRDVAGVKKIAAVGYRTANYVTDYTQTLTPGTWYHIMMTYAGGTGNQVVYLNGTAVITQAIGTGTQAGFVAGLRIFERTGVSLFSSSKADELGFWNRELTSGEITQLYNAGSGISYPFGTSTFIPKIIIS